MTWKLLLFPLFAALFLLSGRKLIRYHKPANDPAWIWIFSSLSSIMIGLTKTALMVSCTITWSRPKMVSKCANAARFLPGLPPTSWNITFKTINWARLCLLSRPIDSSLRITWQFLASANLPQTSYISRTYLWLLVRNRDMRPGVYSLWPKGSTWLERSWGAGTSSRPEYHSVSNDTQSIYCLNQLLSSSSPKAHHDYCNIFTWL